MPASQEVEVNLKIKWWFDLACGLLAFLFSWNFIDPASMASLSQWVGKNGIVIRAKGN